MLKQLKEFKILVNSTLACEIGQPVMVQYEPAERMYIATYCSGRHITSLKSTSHPLHWDKDCSPTKRLNGAVTVARLLCACKRTDKVALVTRGLMLIPKLTMGINESVEVLHFACDFVTFVCDRSFEALLTMQSQCISQRLCLLLRNNLQRV